MEYRAIGENIRKYRNRLDLTQEELADRIGISWEMISRYERGESSPLNKLDRLSQALGISITDLINDNINTGYQVPLFDRIPKNLLFTKENTTLFYHCPKWLILRDPGSFAIETNLIKNDTYISLKDGYLFFSPNSKLERGDLILVIRKGFLDVKKYKHNGDNPLGRLMMQEILFTR